MSISAGTFKDLSSRKPGPVPHWVDRNSFRQAMLKRVNRLTKGRWGAVSMRDGVIWFRYGALKDVFLEACHGDPGLLALQADSAAFNDLIYSVLVSFNDQCILWGFLGKGFCGTKCRVINRSGEITETTYLTPIRATWLNMLPSVLERLKPYELQEAVAKIQPIWRTK